jgi:hypothetical protein
LLLYDLFADSLKIGDYVILKDVTLGCFLSVEGILNDDVFGVDSFSSIHDALFCVHLQRQYSAARELNAFLEQFAMDVSNINDENELKYLQALEVGVDKILYCTLFDGIPVVRGDAIMRIASTTHI